MRKPTVCQACGYPSYNGRVCKACRKFYGGTVENCIAAATLAHRLEGTTHEQAFAILAELCDVIVPDWPGVVNHTTIQPVSGADRRG